jgi:hypothetical protein
MFDIRVIFITAVELKHAFLKEEGLEAVIPSTLLQCQALSQLFYILVNHLIICTR